MTARQTHAILSSVAAGGASVATAVPRAAVKPRGAAQGQAGKAVRAGGLGKNGAVVAGPRRGELGGGEEEWEELGTPVHARGGGAARAAATPASARAAHNAAIRRDTQAGPGAFSTGGRGDAVARLRYWTSPTCATVAAGLLPLHLPRQTCMLPRPSALHHAVANSPCSLMAACAAPSSCLGQATEAARSRFLVRHMDALSPFITQQASTACYAAGVELRLVFVL
jgi:hypothetical protein